MKDMLSRIKHKKKQLDSFRPLPPGIIQNLGERLRIELTYHSNAIEGNTLTRQQTTHIIKDNMSVGGKSIYEIYEARNHDEALKKVLQLGEQTGSVTISDILLIHQIILNNIDTTHAGVFRTVPVRISGSLTIFPYSLKVPLLMDEFNERLAIDSEDVLLRAIQAHFTLVSIHPFVDGNGRTARLLFNLLLLKGGYPLSFVSKQDREEYISGLEKRSMGGSKDENVTFMLGVVERSLDLYLDAVTDSSNEKNTESTRLMRIGKLSKETGLPVPTLRYRTQEGLLPIHSKTKSNYALYDDSSIQRCKNIQEMKKKRYTIKEIRGML